MTDFSALLVALCALLGCSSAADVAGPRSAAGATGAGTGSGGTVTYVGGAGSSGATPAGGGGDANVAGNTSSGGVSATGGAAPSAGAAGSAAVAGGGSGGVANSCPDLGSGPIAGTTQHLDIGVHDPALIWSGARYYLFATGGMLNMRSSTNLQQWGNAGKVFNALPAWITTALGTTPPDGLWAPDISYFNNAFHVYYAGSLFATNNSVIGLATSPTLDAPQWTDQGQVVRTTKADNYNAIDPSVSFDAECAPWLVFGSFWSGIKLQKLDAASGKASTSDTKLYALAGRNGGAIEAPSIISHSGFYYLFVSFDACCKAANSTYRTMVGRAKSITGPYTNKAGVDMMQGGAEQLLATEGRYIGPGGGTAMQSGTNYLYVFHYYDGDQNGNSKLQIRPINFDATDWPTLGEPLFP